MNTRIVYKIEKFTLQALAYLAAGVYLVGLGVFAIIQSIQVDGFKVTYLLIKDTLIGVRERIDQWSLRDAEQIYNTPPKSKYFRKQWEEIRAFNAKEGADELWRLGKPGAREKQAERTQFKHQLDEILRWTLFTYFIIQIVRLSVGV